MQHAGVVLCGGRGRRMGRPKEGLPFGPETMLARVVRILRERVEPIVVVTAAGRELPPLPPEVFIAYDRQEDRGPLEGIAVGLAALRERAEAAYVTSCDVPLLKPALVGRMLELAAGHDVAVPHIDGRDQPLAAVYRTDLVPKIEALLVADRRRPVFLFDEVDARRVAAGELVDVDPDLRSLANVNTPAEYEAALANAGFGRPE